MKAFAQSSRQRGCCRWSTVIALAVWSSQTGITRADEPVRRTPAAPPAAAATEGTAKPAAARAGPRASGSPLPGTRGGAKAPVGTGTAAAAPEGAPPDKPAPPSPGEGTATPAAAPAAALAPQPPVAPEGPVAAPDLGRDLANLDGGGLRESLSDTPNFVGDGCAPTANASRAAIGRVGIVSQRMFLEGGGIAGAQTLFGKGAGVYQFPSNLQTITALQAAGVKGVPAGSIGPLARIPGGIKIPVTNPAGGPNSIIPPTDYPNVANEAFQTLYPNASNPVTSYVPDASGFLGAGGTAGQSYDSYAFYDYVVDVNSLMPGANVGFLKLAENVSPLPRDRVYMNYSYFNNALLGDMRQDVNRFTPGLEKTFYDGWTSIEVRTPFASTYANSQFVDPNDPCGLTDGQAVEFGNMSVIFKSIIALGQTWAWSGGMQVALPTAGDTIVRSAPGGQTLVRVNNDSVRLMPFSGLIWAPNDRWYSQTLLQLDTATNGNPAYLGFPGSTTIPPGGLAQVGKLQYPTFLYLSFSGGYWLYKNDRGRLTGFSPIAELHVNQALQGSDVLDGPNYKLGNNYGVISLVNGVVGANWEWGKRSTLTAAYVTPLGGGVDRWFDGEARLFYNWRFGPQSNLTRAQF